MGKLENSKSRAQISRQSLAHPEMRQLVRRDEFEADPVDAVALVGGSVEALAFEDVAEVALRIWRS